MHNGRRTIEAIVAEKNNTETLLGGFCGYVLQNNRERSIGEWSRVIVRKLRRWLNWPIEHEDLNFIKFTVSVCFFDFYKLNFLFQKFDGIWQSNTFLIKKMLKAFS